MTALTPGQTLAEFRGVLVEWQEWVERAIEHDGRSHYDVRFAGFLAASFRGPGRSLESLMDERTRLNGYWRPAADRLSQSAGEAWLRGQSRPRSQAQSLTAAEIDRVCAYGEQAANAWRVLCEAAGRATAGRDPRERVPMQDLAFAWAELQGTMPVGKRSRLSPLAAQVSRVTRVAARLERLRPAVA